MNLLNGAAAICILCLRAFTAVPVVTASNGMMSMGGTVQDFLIELERAGKLNGYQLEFLQKYYLDEEVESEPTSLSNTGRLLNSVDSTTRKEKVESFLVLQEEEGQMDQPTIRYLSNLLGLDLNARYASIDDHPELQALNESHPVSKTYQRNGIVQFLSRIDPSPPPMLHGSGFWGSSETFSAYMGIWGYATGAREYALLCHSNGLHIFDVTVPESSYRIQYIPMDGGFLWRDVETHTDTQTNTTYAYVSAQSGGNLFVVDLSPLSGDPQLEPEVDGNPCPYADLGYTDYGHTLSVQNGLLFLNSAARESRGCQIFDLLEDPWNPKLLRNSYNDSFTDCHDSYARFDVMDRNSTKRDLLYSADGWTSQFRIVDITDIRNGTEPTILGETPSMPFLSYAHSLSISEDGDVMYVFDELNSFDIGIWNITDPTNITLVRTFCYAEHPEETSSPSDSSGQDGDEPPPISSRVHNGHVVGEYLFVAYYEAGFRVYNISDPYLPVEIGKYDTYLDPGGEGPSPFQERPLRTVRGYYAGAWNLYAGLPSGNVLVTDWETGLFVLRLNDGEDEEEDEYCQDLEDWNDTFECNAMRFLSCKSSDALPGNKNSMNGMVACCYCGGGKR